jgi:hypothetical protein
VLVSAGTGFLMDAQNGVETCFDSVSRGDSGGGGAVREKGEARTSLGLYEYIEESRPFGKEIIIGTGTIGFVGHSKMDTIVLAFPNDQTRSYANIEELRWGQFRSVVCNWGTFREQFDIDM